MAEEESAPPPPAEDAAPPEEAPPADAPPAEAPPAEAPPAEAPPAEAPPAEAPPPEAPIEAPPAEAPAEAPPPPQEAPAEPEAKPVKSTSFQGVKGQPSRSHSGLRAERSESKRHLSDEASREALIRRKSDRPSKARLALGSVISLKRGSVTGEYFDKAKAPRYMNSYKLESDKPFHIEKVEKILQNVLVETMEDLTYDADKCAKQAKWACSAIRAKVKEQEFDRYKLVIMVTFGEKMCQDFMSTCRFLWDCERDKFARFSHENAQVFGIALCFGIYYE